MKKKLLCTGSCGFIMSNFIRHILYNNNKFDIVSIDKITYPHSLNNIYANKSNSFYIGDISDSHFVDIVFQVERPDIVIHSAAENQTSNTLINSNVLGTQVIIDNCVKYNVDKLLYISTNEVLGQLINETDLSFNELSFLNPRNLYAASKASGELLINAANLTQGLRSCIVRLCSNFGPRQSNISFVPNIIKNVLDNKPIELFGTGSYVREWSHVFDTCGALSTMIDSLSLNDVYNISTNWEISNLELCNQICNLMEKGHDLIKFIPDPNPNRDFRRSCSSSLKLKELGWAPKFKFKEALKQCINWYINNKWFLRIPS